MSWYGLEKMEGERGRDFRKLIKAQKEKDYQLNKTLSLRDKFGKSADFLSTIAGFIPGAGKIASKAIDYAKDYAAQKVHKFDKGEDLSAYDTMWTDSSGKETQREYEKLYDMFDPTELEHLVSAAGKFAKSDEGSEFLGDLFGKTNLGDLFSKARGKWEGKIGKESPIKQFDPETLASLLEDSRKQDYLSNLSSFEQEFGKETLGSQLKSDISRGARGLGQFGKDVANIPFEIGKGIFHDLPKDLLSEISGNQNIPSQQRSDSFRQFDLLGRENLTIEDLQDAFGHWSPEAQQALLNASPEERMRMVSSYRGGGMIPSSKEKPTITDYFASQGKTLGGSDKLSLSQKLGRK